MPIAILDSDSAHRSRLDASFRRKRPGPELDLIESFLRAMPLHIPRGCQATVFREPQLESGFPDLVIVVWRVATTREWRPARIALQLKIFGSCITCTGLGVRPSKTSDSASPERRLQVWNVCRKPR